MSDFAYIIYHLPTYLVTTYHIRGAFFNYVDNILAFFNPYLPLFDICDGIPLLSYIIDISSTTKVP